MNDIIRLVGPNRAVELFGIRLVGVNAENAGKLLFTIAFIVVVVLVSKLLQKVIARWAKRRNEKAGFWTRQGIRLGAAIVLAVGIASIWFDDPTRLATALGLITAGLAFALQKAVAAIAGYFIILRGNTFNVGDRITMGGVRGDVIALDFTQTTIMEMGQPPPVQAAEPAVWVKSRQYTGRVVTVSNAKIFDEPVYNYSREFPYLWEEMMLPIAYTADREKAEQILVDVAREYTVPYTSLSEDTLEEMRRRYYMKSPSLEPRVFYRLTDNWLELTVRFIVEDHGVREVKDQMSRAILKRLEEAGIGLASATFEIVGLPEVKLERVRHTK